MKNYLRYAFIAVLAFICNVSFAQTYLWQEDFSNYEADAVPTGGTYSYVCTDGGGNTKIYKESLAGGTSPELLVGKKKSGDAGSFTATIPLNGKTGNMTLAFKANKNVVVTATGATVGEQARTGNDFTYPITVTANTENITITIASATTSNTRLDNIKLFQGEAKKPAGLSWGTASRTVTIGSEENVFPTLTNSNKLPITYTSSEESVATINAEGVITLVAKGVTNITASFAGNAEYEASKVTYELTVKTPITVDISNTPETAYTVAKAKELIAAGEGLETKVYVAGIISKVAKVALDFGNANYNISDDGTTDNDMIVFRGLYLDGEKFTSEDQIKVGDKVVVYGKLINYNNTTPEIEAGSKIYSLNGQTTNIKDITTEAADANAPAYNLAGQKVGKAYKGVVIKAGKKFIQK